MSAERRISRRSVQQPAFDAGMETRVFAHNVERIIQSGDNIISATQQDGTTVLKNYRFTNESPLVDGFNETLRDELDEHYHALCTQYGQKFFPRQRFLRLPPPHVHDEQRKRQFVLVQERIKLADPADVFDYKPGQLPESAKVLIEELVAKRKDSYCRYLEDPSDKTNRVLDFMGRANVVVCLDGSIKYLDTSSKRRLYVNMPYHIPVILGTTAILETISGHNPKEILADSFYQALVRHKRFASVAKQAGDPNEFFDQLRYVVYYRLYDEESNNSTYVA